MEIDKILLRAESDTLQYTGVKLSNPHPFDIRAGKAYVVMGENGSGKTTLGKIIEKGWNIGMNRIISIDDSPIKICVVTADEEIRIARETDSLVSQL